MFAMCIYSTVAVRRCVPAVGRVAVACVAKHTSLRLIRGFRGRGQGHTRVCTECFVLKRQHERRHCTTLAPLSHSRALSFLVLKMATWMGTFRSFIKRVGARGWIDGYIDGLTDEWMDTLI